MALFTILTLPLAAISFCVYATTKVSVIYIVYSPTIYCAGNISVHSL